MNINKIFLLNFNDTNDFNIKQVAIENDKEVSFSKSIKNISEYGMKNYFDLAESLENPKKYSISLGENDEKTYHIDLLEKIRSSLDEADFLENIELAVDNGKLLYNIAIYVEDDEKYTGIYIYEIKESHLLRDDFYVMKIPFTKQKINLKKKGAGTTNEKLAVVENVAGSVGLPTEGYIVSFFKRKKDDEQYKIYKVKVYDAWKFDDVFGKVETRKKYVRFTLEKFANEENPIKIANDAVQVVFKNEDEETSNVVDTVEAVIMSDMKLVKTFSNFHNNSRRKIKNIEVSRLREVLNLLKDYVLNNAEANFELKNIPTLDEKGNLIVNADSTPIFAALLENKIIQRLLNNDIEIPYYKKD